LVFDDTTKLKAAGKEKGYLALNEVNEDSQ